MDSGDNGDNLRQTLCRQLKSIGFSESDALWITDGAWQAADAATAAMSAVLENHCGPDIPVNAERLAIALVRTRLDVADRILDMVARDAGMRSCTFSTTATGIEVMAPASDGRTVQ